jgi:endonuclease/exonuclease/phosphatase family metal-dependent hydrolase
MNQIKLFLFVGLFSTAAFAQSFTIGTQNLYHWMKDYDTRLANMKEEIKLGVPEIVGFQEAAVWKNGESLYNEFINLTLYSAHHQVTNSFGVMAEGIGFASKFPGQNCIDLELPNTTFNSRQWINVCDFTTQIGQIRAINVHTSPGPWATSNRTDQIKFIVDFLRRTQPKIPVVIVGDFNDEFSSVSFEPLKKIGFIDVKNGEGPTYDSTANPYATYSRVARLDYIFYHPRQLRLMKADFMFKKNLVSDHFGLKAQFTRP